MEPYKLTLTEAAAAIKKKELSPLELTESSLTRLEEVEGRIQAFATVTADIALARASAAGDEIAAGHYRGALHGIPVGVKDIYDTAGIRTSSGSRVQANRVPDRDSAVVASLGQAGMIMIGKTRTHEFAFGTTTPPARNPWDTSKIPGGSSGGSGAAVASGSCHVATGSDTGGSTRTPAALCGTVGLKPTYGRVSRFGITPLAWSLDHAGVLTRNVTDAALVLNAIAGYDPRDPGSANVPVPDFTADLEKGVKGMMVGIPKNFFTRNIHPEVAAAVAEAAGILEDLGAEPAEVEIPFEEEILAVEWGILMPEASAYHRRSIGETPELYTPEVRRLLEVGQTILATDYIDALRVRRLIQQAWKSIYQNIRVLIAPATVAPAAPVGDPDFRWPDGSVEGVGDAYVRMAAPANLTGLPAISVPCGFSNAGLPLGLQIIGRPFDESTVLSVARAYEKATNHVGNIAPS
ncbi:amidase [Arthrobacter sp. GCM10027362]|uniref:amidase n=1 Tax=Arthrobacter sp. GCM10027362 TaxID=3273379 RepID=UPI003636DB12